MYRLEITKEEARAVAFSGGRYSWSKALGDLLRFEDDGTPAPLELREAEAWELRDAFEEDTEGGHSYFPLLDGRSDLARKLFAFLDSIV